MVGMATPGGPSSNTQRQMINSWLAEPSLGLDETRMLMRMLFDEHPVLNDLVDSAGHSGRPRVARPTGRDYAALRTGRWRLDHGGPRRCRAGRARAPDDFGSMRSRPGHYEIERSVYNDDVRLRKELTHQIAAYLGSRKELPVVWTSPVVGPRNAAQWLEFFVEQGGLPPGE